MPVYTYTTLDDPSATNFTQAFGINSAGQIVGSYGNASGTHGFLLSGGTYTTIDDPLATAGPLHTASTPRARSWGFTSTPAGSTASSTAVAHTLPSSTIP
jgi:uncharacterized membrane protein